MLAQLLEKRGCIAVSLPSGTESEEMMSVLSPTKIDLICISALQPYAFAPARNVCRRLRVQCPGVRIVVGIWGFTGSSKGLGYTFEPAILGFSYVHSFFNHPSLIFL